MPSDERMVRALDALRGPIASHRAAVAAALTLVREYLAAHRAPALGKAEVAATALGRFAGGRVDASRFAAAFGGTRVLAPEDAERIQRCVETLESLTRRGDDAFQLELRSGADLELEVDGALGQLGRAFGAVLAFQAVKTRIYREEVHGPLLEAFPYERWNRAERLVAPPLVVSVAGVDVDPARLHRFMDGRLRLILVVRGDIAPAALAGLVSPGVLVMQASDAGALSRVATASAPAIAALVPDAAARFIHDPAGGSRIADRFTLQSMPAEKPRRAIGRYSAWQQEEQLATLAALAAAARAESNAAAGDAMESTVAVAAAAAAGGGAQAVDTLAGWLLTQAGMTEGAAR